MPEERLAALRAPAGMDLGAETPEEIALSILAELVQVRRGRALVRRHARTGDAGRRRPGRALEAASLAPVVDDIVLLDPVCGMTVDREHARHLAEHDGVVYAFCSMGCRTAFIKEPGAFVPGIDHRRGLTAASPRRPTCSSRAPSRSPRRATRVWAFLMDPNQVGICGPGVESIDVDRRGPLQGEGEGRGRVHLREVRRRHDGRREERPRPRGPQGPRPGAGSAVDATANMALSGPAEGPDDDGLVGRRADRRARSPRSARG